MRMASRRLLITASLLAVTIGRSIRNEIEQIPELSMTRQYMQDLDLWNQLGFVQQTYTFFAPINGAYQNIPRSVRDALLSTSSSESAKQAVNQMYLNHGVVAQQVMTTAIMTGSSASSMAQGAKLFFRDINGEKFVNGARFKRSDIICDNGVLHIVDVFMYQEMENKPAYTVIDEMKNNIETEQSTRYFVQLLNTYKSEPSAMAYWPLNGLDGVFITAFVPSDRTFEPLIAANPNFMRDLENNKNELIKVIGSHVIGGDASAVYHSSVLRALGDLHQTIDAYQGSVVPRYFNHELYVSNNCAQGRITGANITVNNGVIHIIDGILGYLYYDMFQLLSHTPQFSDMKTFADMASPEIRNILEVLGSTSAPLPASEKYTLFAPIDSAFSALEQASSAGDISQDRAEIDTLFRFHLLEDEVKQMDMSNTTRYRTLHDGHEAKFYIDLDGTTWVEVNHVRARIVRADYCVSNGIVHFVDHVLGLALYTIHEAIQQRENLRELAQSIRRTGFDTYLGDTNKQLTFFAPTDDAFAIMREGAVGRDILGTTVYLRQLMFRLYSTELYWLSDITSSLTIRNDAGSDYTIRRLQDQSFILDYQGKEIRIIMHDEKMLNGNLNIIDAVIYRETPTDLPVSSNARQILVSWLLGPLGFLLFCVIY